MARDRQVRIVIDRMEEITESIITSLAVNISAELIERTPVDTGWARANWVPAIGAEPASVITPNTREARLAATAGRSGAQQTGIASIIAGYKLDRGSVFVSNGVPYVFRLNEGSSDQAPSGFVQEAIFAGVKSLDSRRFT